MSPPCSCVFLHARHLTKLAIRSPARLEAPRAKNSRFGFLRLSRATASSTRALLGPLRCGRRQLSWDIVSERSFLDGAASPHQKVSSAVSLAACGAALLAFSGRERCRKHRQQGHRRNVGTVSECAIGDGYKLPSADFVELVDAPTTPSISIDPTERWMLFMANPPLRSLEDLCREERKLAGLRFDTVRRLPALSSGYTSLTLRPVFGDSTSMPVSFSEAKRIQVVGLPDGAKARSVSWSPKGGRFAFVVLPPGLASEPELWMVILPSETAGHSLPETVFAERLTDGRGNPLLLNGIRGAPFQWHPDGERLLLKTVPWPALPSPANMCGPQTPTGPTVQASTPGQKAPGRTYTDLLRSPEDEKEYEWRTTIQLMVYDLSTRLATPFGRPCMVRSATISPDGCFVLVSTTQRPFSFSVPDSRFAYALDVWELPARTEAENQSSIPVCWTVTSVPIRDKIPVLHDAVADSPRSFMWCPDKPHSLRFLQALDGGDPRNAATHRDQFFHLDGPPYSVEQARSGLKLEMRFNSEQVAKDGTRIVSEYRWKDRKQRLWVVGPECETSAPSLLFDFSFEDKYNLPGTFVRKFDLESSRTFLWKRPSDGNSFLLGSGASPRGSRPFVDTLQLPAAPLPSGQAPPAPRRLWRCVAAPSKAGDPPEEPAKEVGGLLPAAEDRREQFEDPAVLLGGGEDGRPLTLLFWRESQSEPPNLFAMVLESGNGSDSEVQLTDFGHPQPALRGVTKQLVKYTRADGVELNANLFLPPGYDSERDGRLPCLMWAYPREFKSAGAASQVGSSPYTFVRGNWSRPIFWLTRGYAVFDNFAMPVVGEGSQEPNDTFVEQLEMNARAAIDAVVNDLKVADPDRICVGGHSYGAFMTAHLLAHTDGLFRAGICRSGAYNRTLTPFGFQNEERSYWDATDTYTRLSPFSYAKRLAEKGAPLLLMHGQEDPNSGTYPMQSERFFQALKGHGATAKLVLLPKEQHSYSARESILHALHEQDEWLRLHNAPRSPEERQRALDAAAAARGSPPARAADARAKL